MSSPAAAPRRVVPRVVSGALLALLALSAALETAVLVWASGYGNGRPLDAFVLIGLGFVLWGLAPFVAMGYVVLRAARRSRGATAVVTLGVLALVVGTALMLRDFDGSESSTAALIFVVLPVYQLLLVLVTAALAAVIALAVAGRRRAGGSPPIVQHD